MRERSPSCIITAPSRDLGESERLRGTMRDGERGGRSRNSVNGNRGLVCDGVLCTLLAFQIYLKGRERRGSGASLNLRCLFNMCLASTPLGSNLTSVSQKKKKKLQSCEMSSAGRLGGTRGAAHIQLRFQSLAEVYSVLQLLCLEMLKYLTFFPHA